LSKITSKFQKTYFLFVSKLTLFFVLIQHN